MKRLISILLGLLLCLSVFVSPVAQAATYYSGNNAVAWDQRDDNWAWNYYGGGSIYDTACGILSTCNAINFLGGAFSTVATAKNFILDWASYANSIGGFNPGSPSGGYRYVLFGTDYSNPPPLQRRYGSTYKFYMPILWTENWNYANYYAGGYYNNIYVSSQTSLKNYLAGDAVAIAHVPGHFICLADYNPATDQFLVLDSYDTPARGTGSGVAWVSAYDLSGGRPALTVGGYCVLQSTDPTANNPYPYKVDNDTMMLHDGEAISGVKGAYNTNLSIEANNKRQGSGSLLMHCTKPTAQSSGNKVGGMAVQSLKSTTDLSGYNYVALEVYSNRRMDGSNELQINFATNGEDGFNKAFSIGGWQAGWHTLVIDLKSISPINGAAWNKINTIRYTWFNYANDSSDTRILLDNVRATKTKPGLYPYSIDDNSIMLYDGESMNTLTSAFRTTISRNSTKTQGNYSLKMNYDAPAEQYSSNKVGGMVIHTFNQRTSLADYNYIVFDLYVSRDMVGSNAFQVNINTSGEDGFNLAVVLNEKTAGWYTFVLDKNDFTKVVDSANWGNIASIRLTWLNYSGNSNATYFLIDNFRAVKAYDDQIVNNVISLIDAISDPVTIADKSAILTARTEYDKLNDGQKAKVSNYEKLTAAESVIAVLEMNNIAANTVIEKINQLPIDIDLSSEDAVIVARQYYNNLTDAQKLLVSNYQKLLDAEKAIDNEYVIAISVYDLIESIPTQITLDNEQLIVNSRAAYDNLDDIQKTLVDNIDKLEKAEADLAILKQNTPSDQPNPPTPDIIYGDLDANGEITAADALIALQLSVGKVELEEGQLEIVDVDLSGNIASADALLILQKAVSKIDLFPVEK